MAIEKSAFFRELMTNLESPSRIAKEKLISEAKLKALIAASASTSAIELVLGGRGGGQFLG